MRYKNNIRFGIYGIIHKTSNKIYVGSSINIIKRWQQHKSKLSKRKHSSKHLQSAWNNYGQDVFEFKILELVKNKHNLIKREQYWLDHYKSYKRENGYNNRIKAENNIGLITSNKTKILLSKSHRGSKSYMFGKHHPKEVIEKLRKSHLGQKAWNKGKKMSKAFVEQCRLRELGNKRNLGKVHTKETIEKMRRAHLLPRETRICDCGCNQIFVAKVTSPQRFLYTHGNYGRWKRIKKIKFNKEVRQWLSINLLPHTKNFLQKSDNFVNV